MLIPLFKAMGFKDVSHYHGGTGEQGKDITMWQANVLGDREYYAVVVKAGRITGEAKGKGSAAEVQMQIAQAFGSKFTDTADLSERHATQPGAGLSPPMRSRRKPRNRSRTPLDRGRLTEASRFIDGDELWELIQPTSTRADHCWNSFGPRTRFSTTLARSSSRGHPTSKWGPSPGAGTQVSGRRCSWSRPRFERASLFLRTRQSHQLSKP